MEEEKRLEMEERKQRAELKQKEIKIALEEKYRNEQ